MTGLRRRLEDGYAGQQALEGSAPALAWIPSPSPDTNYPEGCTQCWGPSWDGFRGRRLPWARIGPQICVSSFVSSNLPVPIFAHTRHLVLVCLAVWAGSGGPEFCLLLHSQSKELYIGSKLRVRFKSSGHRGPFDRVIRCDFSCGICHLLKRVCFLGLSFKASFCTIPLKFSKCLLICVYWN